MNEDIFAQDLFDDEHVCITGGSGGVNFGIAKRFADKGANLSLIARDQDDLDRSCRTLEDDYDAGAVGLSSDVRDYENLEGVIQDAVDEFGSIDVLVCGAAGNFPAGAAEMSASGFQSVVDIDLRGTFNACRAAYDHLTKPGANILAISAVNADQPIPMQSHVCAAKAGIDAFIRTIAIEWSEDDIRANAIQPGPVKDTEGMERLTPDPESKDRLAEALPAGRFVHKEEIGNLALYLSSPAASGITGAVIPVDGGQTLIGSGKLIDSIIPT